NGEVRCRPVSSLPLDRVVKRGSEVLGADGASDPTWASAIAQTAATAGNPSGVSLEYLLAFALGGPSDGPYSFAWRAELQGENGRSPPWRVDLVKAGIEFRSCPITELPAARQQPGTLPRKTSLPANGSRRADGPGSRRSWVETRRRAKPAPPGRRRTA